jgi:hypothetical protein
MPGAVVREEIVVTKRPAFVVQFDLRIDPSGYFRKPQVTSRNPWT